jgi:hypothetical protein
MAELKLKKQWMSLDANEKCLQLEDHQMTAQHQQEHKKEEQHDLQMLCLHLQYQGSNAAVGPVSFLMDQLAGGTFGGVDQFGPEMLPFNT